MWYKTFLPKLHETLKPKDYVEIGIREGYSLSLSKSARKIAIDPAYAAPEMKHDVGPKTDFYKMKSDDFFARDDIEKIMKRSFDLAYIDGLHLFEYALRDYMNLEKYARKDSIIIVDDVIPRNPEEAARQATGGSWAGDVWKVIACFQDYRPDLAKQMLLAKSEPTGCLIIRNPDPDNTVLWDNYDEILEKYLHKDYPDMPGTQIMDTAVEAQIALDKLKS